MALACFLEGPLPYKPHIVNPLGCIVKPNGKVRNVLDASKTGLNDCLRKLFVRYSSVEDLIKYMVPECYISKIDLADAFFVRPVDATECDLLGVRHETTGEFYRYRFMPFGVASSPWSMQRLAVEIRRIVNEQGLKYVRPLLDSGEPNPAADYAGFRCAAAYLDDFANIHPPWLSKSQADEQYASVLRLYEDFGLDVVKKEKCEWPAQRCEFLGITLDSVEQLATVSSERASKLQDEIQTFVQGLPGQVSRKRIASLAGKLQFVAPYVRDGQASLAAVYKARDAFVDAADARNHRRAWKDSTMVRVDAEALASLARFSDSLSSPEGRRVYLLDTGFNSSFWHSSLVTSPDDVIDDLGVTEQGIDVITTDASGYAGGAWFKHQRFRYAFDSCDASPHSSSNWRELHTIVQAVRRWASELRGRRVLVRTDNSTCVSVITRRTSKSPELRKLYLELSEICHEHSIDLAARHIPGERNTLSDTLSRWRKRYDSQDWQFAPEEFARWNAAFGHDVDACCDPEGFNAHLPRFWSEADNALAHSWSRLDVWCNPPYDAVERYLVHALSAHAISPKDTSATFVVPDWPWASWYHLLGNFRVVHCYPEGTRLFTAPERGAADSARRCDRGATNWPVFVLRLDPTCRVEDPPRDAAAGPADGDVLCTGQMHLPMQRVCADDRQGAGLHAVRRCVVPAVRKHDGQAATAFAAPSVRDVQGRTPAAARLLGERGRLRPQVCAPVPGGRVHCSGGPFRQPALRYPGVLPLGGDGGAAGAAGGPRRDPPFPAAPPARRQGRHVHAGARRKCALRLACLGGPGDALPVAPEPCQAGGGALRDAHLWKDAQEAGATDDEVAHAGAGSHGQELSRHGLRLARQGLHDSPIPGDPSQGGGSRPAAGENGRDRPPILRPGKVRHHYRDAPDVRQVRAPLHPHGQERGPGTTALRLHSGAHQTGPELRPGHLALPHTLPCPGRFPLRRTAGQARQDLQDDGLHVVGPTRASLLRPCVPGRQKGCCLSQLPQIHNSSIIQHRLGRGCDRRHRWMAFRQVHRPEILCFALGRARPRHRRLHLRSGLRGRHHVHGITALNPVIPVTAPRESPALWCPTISLF